MPRQDSAGGEQDARRAGRKGISPMNRAKLRWADGHTEIRADVDPTASHIVLRGEDGENHEFRPTDETDDEGCDIYIEEPDAS
jgi:hypothetical protein